jgi:cell division protein FtsB
MKPRQQNNQGWKYGLLVMGLMLLALLVMDFNNRMAELHRLTAERELVGAQMESLSQTKQALEIEIQYATSEAAVLDWAYEDGHMVRPGDNPVIPLQPSQVVATPTPRPIPTVTAVNSRDAWWALFFGPKTP